MTNMNDKNTLISNYIIQYFFNKYEGDWEKINNAMKSQEVIEINFNFKKRFDNSITFIDENIIHKFRNQNFIPFIFWYKGNLKLLSRKIIVVDNEFNFNELKNIDFDKYAIIFNEQTLNNEYKNEALKYPHILVSKRIKESKDNHSLNLTWICPEFEIDKFFVVEENEKLNMIIYSLSDLFITDLNQKYILEKYNIWIEKTTYENIKKLENKSDDSKLQKNKNKSIKELIMEIMEIPKKIKLLWKKSRHNAIEKIIREKYPNILNIINEYMIFLNLDEKGKTLVVVDTNEKDHKKQFKSIKLDE